MKEKKINQDLTRAKLAEKAVETIRALEANGYNAYEVFTMGNQILTTSASGSTSAHVYKEVI